MKWYWLDESVTSYINNVIEKVYNELDDSMEIYEAYKSGRKVQEIPIPDTVNAAEIIMKAKNLANKATVERNVREMMNKSVIKAFPNFRMDGYLIDLDQDTIKRGNGDVVMETNATNYEKLMLSSYHDMVDYADEMEKDAMIQLDELNEHIREFNKRIRIQG